MTDIEVVGNTAEEDTGWVATVGVQVAEEFRRIQQKGKEILVVMGLKMRRKILKI